MKTVLPLLAEYLGTFLLTFVALTTRNAFVIGGTLAVIIFLIENFSGGLVNPAISYVMYLQSKLSLKDFAYYVAIQMFAALTSYSVYHIVA